VHSVSDEDFEGVDSKRSAGFIQTTHSLGADDSQGAEIIERDAQSFEAAGQNRGLATDAQAEVPRQLEKAPGHNGGLVFFAEQIKEFIRVSFR
jgi:hypothetical protein